MTRMEREIANGDLKVLSLARVKKLPKGKGVRVALANREYDALIVSNRGIEYMYMATENYAPSNPKYQNYGKTWAIVKTY